MPKTATPRKPETVSSKLAETRAKSKNRSLSSLLGIGDNEKRLATDFGSGLNDVIGRGTIAGLLGLPGDLGGAAENGLRSLLGLPQVVPYGGSEHIGQKMEEAGLVSNVRRPKTELLASLISPAQAATAGYKAPQMARSGVKALDNLSAPRTMGRQQGAIENLWHGSPHTFDRFDLSKIGTGEGAQAYGHGAYLAEAPEVAQGYADKLAFKRPDAINSKVDEVLDDLNYHNGSIDAVRGRYQGMIDSGNPDSARYGKEKMDLLDTVVSQEKKSNLYQTRLAWPDAREATDPLSPDHFLHWDKPLSEQTPYVQDAFNKAIESRRTALTPQEDPERWMSQLMALDSAKGYYTGGGSSKALSASFPMEDTDAMRETSRLLAEQGIPGFRYLDGGSRGAGAGSHNYVVFDDKLIDIVSRNGQPPGLLGKMVAPQDEALRVAQANAAKPVSEGGLGLRPDNTPEERAAAMGFDTDAYHAPGANDFDAFSPSVKGKLGAGVYMADEPKYAEKYMGENPRIMPLRASGEYAGSDAHSIASEAARQELKASGADFSVQEWKDKTSDMLRRQGYSGINIGGERVTFDPRNIRSRFAAFDPMRRDSPDLLAGIAPFGAIPWLRDEQP